MLSQSRFLLILACFFLSGFAALLYQTAWTREFAFIFGTSELAIATVLAAYMAGLAAGAALIGKWVDRIERPVRAYGLLELGIAVSALLVPFAIELSIGLCRTFFGGLDAPPEADSLSISLFYLACSFVILMIPTGFMGATLPLLARSAVDTDEQVGSRTGALYAVNTFGAVIGTLVTAFLFLPELGLRKSVYIGIGLNALVFLIAAFGLPSIGARPATERTREKTRWDNRSWVLPLILISGITSFTYEVLWTRLLGLILGGSVYAFATMLATFLTGITLGSLAASRLASTPQRATRGFAIVQLGIGFASYCAFLAVDGLPGFAAKLGAGMTGGLGANAMLCGLILLPGTLFIGATFPFAVRILAKDDHDAAPASARVFAWNTVGAIIGAIGAGFFWIPWLGYAGALTAAIVLNFVLAIGTDVLIEAPTRNRFVSYTAGLLLFLLFIFAPSSPWNVLYYEPLAPDAIRTRPPGNRESLRHFAVGRSATVLLLDLDIYYRLRTNGLPEAKITAPGHREWVPLMHWLTGLPVIARPNAEEMLVIGLGGGTSVEFVPSTISTIDVIELEPEVLNAVRRSGPLREKNPLVDPRLRVFLNDGRGALNLTEKKYDVIVSQPSHPWTAGASHLYTREFFDLAHDHLNPEGVFVQWIGGIFVDEELLRTLVATMTDAFSYVHVYKPISTADYLLIASNSPLEEHLTAKLAIERHPEDFYAMQVTSMEDVLSGLVLHDADSRDFAQGAPLNTDDHNLLQIQSPGVLARSLYKQKSSESFTQRYNPYASIPDADWNGSYFVRRLLLSGNPRAAEVFIEGTEDPALRALYRGTYFASLSKPEQAVAWLREALELDPENVQTRILLTRFLGEHPRSAKPGERAKLLETLPRPALATLDGWMLLNSDELDKAQPLESLLAQIGPQHVLFDIAVLLRVLWRLETGDPERAMEGIQILNGVPSVSGGAQHHVLRAELMIQAGKPDIALSLLQEVYSIPDKRIHKQALRIAQKIPPTKENQAKLQKLKKFLAQKTQ